MKNQPFKILIVKLGALGDVLRTTPLLTALKKKYPTAHFTWIVEAAHADILGGIALIDKLLVYSPEIPDVLRRETFDLLINLDKEKEALDCFMYARAGKKMGFGRGASDGPCAADELSDYAYRLGVDDQLKFKLNRKTYQQISFEQAGIEFAGEEYLFSLDQGSIDYARRYFVTREIDYLNLPRPVIGLNTGSGNRFAGKKLPVTAYVELVQFFRDRMNATVLLLGGNDEIERNRQIEQFCSRPVINSGSHSIRQFAAIVKACDLVVSGDTTAMHIAIAMKVPVVVHFASTCAAEIELYGRWTKIVSDLFCAPCYKRVCPIDELCMKEIECEEIYRAAHSLWQAIAAKSPEERKVCDL